MVVNEARINTYLWLIKFALLYCSKPDVVILAEALRSDLLPVPPPPHHHHHHHTSNLHPLIGVC